MKNIFLIMAIAAFGLVACSKEKKVNKRLDGSWTLVSENDKAIDDESTTVLNFMRDKKEGTGTKVYTTSDGISSTTEFTYTLDNNVLTVGSDMYTVDEYTKEELVLSSTNGTFALTQKFTRN